VANFLAQRALTDVEEIVNRILEEVVSVFFNNIGLAVFRRATLKKMKLYQRPSSRLHIARPSCGPVWAREAETRPIVRSGNLTGNIPD